MKEKTGTEPGMRRLALQLRYLESSRFEIFTRFRRATDVFGWPQSFAIRNIDHLEAATVNSDVRVFARHCHTKSITRGIAPNSRAKPGSRVPRWLQVFRLREFFQELLS